MAEDWKRRSVLKSWAISRTRRWKELADEELVDFWYLRISRSDGTGPVAVGLLHAVAGADLRAAWWRAACGGLLVDLRAVAWYACCR